MFFEIFEEPNIKLNRASEDLCKDGEAARRIDISAALHQSGFSGRGSRLKQL